MIKIQLIMKILIVLLIISYPFVIFFGLHHFSLSSVALLVIFMGLLRFFFLFFVTDTPRQPTDHKNVSSFSLKYRHHLNTTTIMLVVSLILATCSLLFQSLNWMLFYPAIVNLILLLSFSYSLFNPPSIIERFARIQNPDLPKEAIAYTRKITKIWCLFFIINGLIALLTTVNIEYWTLYNGFISYLLIGLLLSAEYVYRKIKIKES